LCSVLCSRTFVDEAAPSWCRCRYIAAYFAATYITVAMLVAAFVILAVAVLLGSFLAVLHLQTEGRATLPWQLAALHGILAISGLCCLALALRGPLRGLDQGTASFGLIATALIALAALVGGVLLAGRVFKRPDRGDSDWRSRDACRERLRHSRRLCLRGITRRRFFRRSLQTLRTSVGVAGFEPAVLCSAGKECADVIMPSLRIELSVASA
jgi:hypothetical protein